MIQSVLAVFPYDNYVVDVSFENCWFVCAGFKEGAFKACHEDASISRGHLRSHSRPLDLLVTGIMESKDVVFSTMSSRCFRASLGRGSGPCFSM